MPAPSAIAITSFEHTKGLYDPQFVRSVEGQFPETVDGVGVSTDADRYVAKRSVEFLKTIDHRLGGILNSERFHIATIEDLALFEGDFDHPDARLSADDAEVLRSTRAALQIASVPVSPENLGYKVTITENDMGLAACMARGYEIIKHNKGEEGAAIILLRGNPRAGFAPSKIDVDFGSYKFPGRGGHLSTAEAIHVDLDNLPLTCRATADALVAAFRDKGLAAKVVPGDDGAIQIKVWSIPVLD